MNIAAVSGQKPDWEGHCGVGGSITDPRSVPDQGGEWHIAAQHAGYHGCANEVCFPLAVRIGSTSCISWAA